MEHLDDNKNEDLTPNTDQFDESLLGDPNAAASIEATPKTETAANDLSITNGIAIWRQRS